MDPRECKNKLAPCHSWYVSPLLDLQADSCACVQNGSPLLLHCYLYLDFSKHHADHDILKMLTAGFIYVQALLQWNPPFGVVEFL